jgi:hypothetical protein
MNNQKIAFSKVYQSSNNDINEINIEWKKYYALERRMKSISNKEHDNKNKMKELDKQKQSLNLKFLTLEQETINNLNDKDTVQRQVIMKMIKNNLNYIFI